MIRGLLYIIYRAGALAILTTTHSILLLCIYLVLVICVLGAVKKHKYILPLIIVTLVSLLVQSVYIRNNQSASISMHYIGTGLITDIVRQDRYILQTAADTYIIDTQQTIYPGQEVFVQGYITPQYTKSLMRHNPHYMQDIQQRLSFDYPKWLLMRGFQGRIYAKDIVTIAHHDISLLAQARQTIRQKIQNLPFPKDHKALLAGVLIGDRSFFVDTTYQMMIDSGLVHLIAVSGGNIIFIILALSIVFFFVPFYIRIGLIILCIIVYALICGGDSSVLRASIMGILSLGALFRGRQSYIRQSLGISFVALTAYNPYMLLYDIGFVFSYAAVIGIVLTTQYYDTKVGPYIHIYCTKIVKRFVLPSLGAMLGIFPFLLLFTDKLNITSIITNSVLAPFVGVYMIISVCVIYIDLYVLQYIYTILTTRFYTLATRTAQYGIYLVIDALRFPLVLCIMGIIYALYTINYHHKKIV